MFNVPINRILVVWMFGAWALAAAEVSANADEATESAQTQPNETQESDAADLQSAAAKALDSTATQWSFQFAYQMMPSYHRDVMDNGQMRPAGSDNFFQFRLVAPIPLKGVTILPRVTLRHYENAEKEAGFGNTEVFALIIPRAFDWGSGRAGIGPLVTFPGNKKVARDEFGYGVAGAAINSSGPWFYGILMTQSWRSIDPTALPPGNTTANPLGINPILNFQLGGGWYIGNGDMVGRYDWNSKKFYLPVGIRAGKVLVQKKGSWNIYVEYQTSAIYKSYPGAAVKNSIRFNVSYTIPVG